MLSQEQIAAAFAEQLRQFIHPGDQVLLCFTNQEPGSLCANLTRALRSIGAFPIFWGHDLRWKTLLRQGFLYGVTAACGSSSMLAALGKLAAATATPLRIQNVFLCGGAEDVQLQEVIVRWLDCRIWKCSTDVIDEAAPCEAQLQQLMVHGSILDYRTEQSMYGMELEIVVFAGKPLPKLPTCARRIVRVWNPETDQPLRGDF